MSSVRVGVFGAGGRMGQTVCQAVVADPDLELVAAVDPHYAGFEVCQVAGVADCQVMVASDPATFVEAGVDVAIDFTEITAARANLHFLAANHIHAVVGTSGFGDDDLADLSQRFIHSNCVIAPNFAIGAVLMMRFAELAAPFFDTAEIVEFHHDQKIDAPSGTAMSTAARMAAASTGWAPDPTTAEVLPGARGGRGDADVPIHSVRMRGMVAHQEVILGAAGQTLVIRHDSIDRTSFMPGVVLAVREVGSRSGLVVGLERLMESGE